MSKKNLDKLFQEKFKDFGEVPDQKVWNTIEASLDKKKQTRIIPLWWKLGGAAAILALGIFLLNPFATTEKSIPAVTDTNPTESENGAQKEIQELPKNSDNAITNSASDKEKPHPGNKERVEAGKSSIADRDKKGGTLLPNKAQPKQSNSSNSENTPFVTTKTKKSKDSNTLRNKNAKEADTKLVGVKNTEALPHSQNEGAGADVIVTNEKNNALKDEQSESTLESASKNSGVQKNTPLETEEKLAENTSASDEPDPKKKSIFEAVEEQGLEAATTEVPIHKWSAGPSVAPVYFDALGKGSPINSIFAQNAKSGTTNLSYGVSVAYEINKRFSVRTGLHKVDYGYDTNNVEFSASLEASSTDQIKNIDYATTSKNLVVESDGNSFSGLESFGVNNLAFELSVANNSARNGIMAQQFGYLEVPLELDYALIDNKFGLTLVGGISSLFLLDNSVTLTSGELTTEIGEANNMNTVNFSTNIGFGLTYSFSPKIQLNIEPVFKYQLNTFSDVSGTFQPFTIGVYSGLNFKF